jgi:hypothetical protein
VLGNFSSQAKPNEDGWLNMTKLGPLDSHPTCSGESKMRSGESCLARVSQRCAWVNRGLRSGESWLRSSETCLSSIRGLAWGKLGLCLRLGRIGHDYLGRDVASGELWPRARCCLGHIVALDELCPVCHAIEDAQWSARSMKETNRWLFQSGARREGGWLLPIRRPSWAPWSSTVQHTETNTSTYNILRGSDHALVCSKRDLSELCVETMLVFICTLFLHLCVCSCCICALVCCFFLSYSCYLFWSYRVRCERLVLVKIHHKHGHTIRKTTVILKFDLWNTWEGLSATLVRWDATTWR